MRKLLKKSVLIWLTALSLLVAGCFGGIDGSDNNSSRTYVTIGALLPLTGSLSEMGQGMKSAVNIGIADMNRHLEAEGSNIRLTVEFKDSATDPETALNGLKELYASGIRIVIGPGSSSEAAAILDYANSKNILLISNATAPSLAVAGDNLLRLAPSDIYQGDGLAKLMDTLNIERLITVNRNDNYGNELAEEVRTSFEALGGHVEGSVVYDTAASDYSSLINQIKTLTDAAVSAYGADKVAVQLTSMEEAKDILKAANGTTLSQVKWFGSDGNANHSIILSDSVAASFAASVSFRSPIFTVDESALGMPKKVLPDRSLRQRIYTEYGGVTDTTSLIGYDAVWLIGLALLDRGADADAAAVIDAIFEVTTNTEPGLAGASGRLELTAAGDKEDSGYIFYEVKDSSTSSATYSYNFSGVVTPVIIALTPSTVTIPSVPGNVIKLGALIPLTGSLSQSGLSIKAGIEEAVSSINRYFDFYGSDNRVVLTVKDTATDPAQAVAKLTELHDEGIEMVIGPSSSAAASALLPYLSTYGMVMISPATTAASLAVAGDNFYRFTLSDENMASALAMLLSQDGITRVVSIYRNDTWGTGLNQSFKTAFTARGGTVSAEVAYSSSGTDFSAALTTADTACASAITAGGAAATAVILFSYEEGITVLGSASAYPSLAQVKWYGGDGMAKNEALFSNTAAADFASASSFTAAIYSILEVGGKTTPDPISRQVVADSIKLGLGFSPITHAYMAWDAAWVSSLAYAAYKADSSATLGSKIASQSAAYIGLSNYMALNSYGDRRYGEYGFFTVDKTSGSYSWDLSATYHYTPIDYSTPAITRP